MIALGSLTFVLGTAVVLRGGKTRPMTQADVARLCDHVGQVLEGQWRAVVDGVAYSAIVEVAN